MNMSQGYYSNLPETEFSERNYKRINLINWGLSLPMLILFAWPYYYLASMMNVAPFHTLIGSALFATPFMVTIIHGHVTMALGSLHRGHFYNWLLDKPLTHGLFFHTALISTRFRLITLLASFIVLVIGYFST